MPSRVQQIIDEQGSLVFPGVYDPLSAKIAEQAGFPMAFVSGYAVSATLLGEPDLGLLTQTEVIERARRICKAVTIPIIVDADTGYGSALNVMRTVNELIDAGAAGCFLEDQEWPKRCGHMPDKRVIGREEYLQKIGAAVDTRGDRDFFIVARTDALAPAGLDEALARVDAARAAGADATFVEAPRTLAELEAIGRRAPAPTVANMIEHGRTPVLDQTRLAALGRLQPQPHPVPARRSVRVGVRVDRDLPASARGGDQQRGRRHADDVRPVQRLDRRGPAARAGGQVVRLIAQHPAVDRRGVGREDIIRESIQCPTPPSPLRSTS